MLPEMRRKSLKEKRALAAGMANASQAAQLGGVGSPAYKAEMSRRGKLGGGVPFHEAVRRAWARLGIETQE